MIAHDEMINVNAYIKKNKSKVNPRYRHKYHFMAPIGWINDPNGFSIYKAEYHLFYQYYPYDSIWGPMFWGHASSKDLVTWKHLPVALEPGDEHDRNGIFSGTALQVGEEHWLYYTGHVDPMIEARYDSNHQKREVMLSEDKLKASRVEQVQCLAKSKDGIHYEKHTKAPILTPKDSNNPRENRTSDFRDPKVWKHEDKFYMAVGSKNTSKVGQTIFYVSDNGIEWRYLNTYTLGAEYGTVWECPDVFQLGNKHILMISPQDKPKVGCHFENIHSTIALIGKFDYETGLFEMEKEQEMDQGFDFYAPQSVKDMNGNMTMIAWMNMWERTYVPDEKGHGWEGAMTIPRTLELRNGRIYQQPVIALDGYHQGKHIDKVEFEGHYKHPQIKGDVLDISMTIDLLKCQTVTINLFESDGEKLVIKLNKMNEEVTLDRSLSSNKVESLGNKDDSVRTFKMSMDEPIQIRLLLDVSSVELFFNEGEYAMTSLFYGEDQSNGISFNTDGLCKIYDINVNEIVL